MASLEVGLSVLWAHKSGDGVSALRPGMDAGLEDAAERGRGMGLNSEALAFKRRGDEIGEAGRLVAY